MKRSTNIILAGIMTLLLAAGCKSTPDSYGNIDEIVVFADSSDWVDYRDGIRQYFSQEYLTPVPEVEYQLNWQPFSRFENHKRKRNLMFLSRLDAADKVSSAINVLLNEEIIDGVKSGDYFYIPQENTWARGQYVVFMVAPTKNDMIQRIYDLGELVYDDFEKYYYNRLKTQMFKREENTDMEEYFLNHFPFTMRVQHDYRLVDESVDNRYIWLRRVYPDRDRSITVSWFPNNDSLRINREWIVEKRNALARRIHEGDVIVEDETTMEQVRFQRWAALRLEGTWKNPTRFIGGPFRTITFVDKKSNLIFMIDFFVQAIGERKKVYLDQLDVIAHTFRSKSYIDAESE